MHERLGLKEVFVISVGANRYIGNNGYRVDGFYTAVKVDDRGISYIPDVFADTVRKFDSYDQALVVGSESGYKMFNIEKYFVKK